MHIHSFKDGTLTSFIPNAFGFRVGRKPLIENEILQVDENFNGCNGVRDHRITISFFVLNSHRRLGRN